MADDRVQIAELPVGARQHRRLEHAADDARHLHRPPRPLGRGVDPAEDQRVEAVRQPDGLDRRRIPGVDALGDDEADQLLDVERVPLGPRRDQVDEGVAHLGLALAAEQLLHLRAHELPRRRRVPCGRGRARRSRRCLRRRGRRRAPSPAGRRATNSTGSDVADRIRTSRRSRESSSIQWQSSSTATIGALPARARRQTASRSSSDVLRSLASKPRVRSESGIDSPTTSLEERRARLERPVDGGQLPAQGGDLARRAGRPR